MSVQCAFQAVSTVSGGGLRAIPGATATVYATGTTNRVNIYNSSGVPINNPGVTDANGFFTFFAPEGVYDVFVQSGSLVYTQTIEVVLPPKRVLISDENYAASASDGGVSMASITAPRTITLPLLSTMVASKQFPVGDESGSASQSLTITVVPSGSDMINGQATPLMIETPYQVIAPRAGATSWLY